MQRGLVPSNPDGGGLSVPSGRRTGTVDPVRKHPDAGASGAARANPPLPNAGKPRFAGGAAMRQQLTRPIPIAIPTVVAPAGAFVALLGFYIMLHTGLGGEVLKIFLHVPFPVVAIFAVIVPLAAGFTGRVGWFFRTPVAVPWLLMLAWMTFSAITSFYPRESVSEVLPYGLRFHIMPLLFCAIATTSKSVRSLIVWAAMGMFPVLLLCFVKGEMVEGIRFAVPDTSLENPNDLAFLLLWGSTLLLIFLLGKGKLGKIVTLAAIPSCFWFILKTASRANFITIFFVLAVAVIISAPPVRIFLLVAVPIGLAITLPLLPKSTLDRILSVVVSSSISDVAQQSNSVANAELKGAIGSEAERMELAKLAIDATFRHPVFGVGMSMFATETADYFMKNFGTKAPWLTAHDSYLKISSESGIPGLIFYVWSIVAGIGMTWRTFIKSRGHPEFQTTNRNSICVLLALVVYAVGTFFCDIVYFSYLSITMGLAAANFLSFRNESAMLNAATPVSQPVFQPNGSRLLRR
jgi:O-antigen ligase